MKHLLIIIIYIINHIRKIPSVLLIVGILCGCFQNLLLSAQNMKSHHLADGTFKNNYIDSIDKPFSELLKWQWNRVSPEPLAFPLAENDPVFLKNNRIEPTLTWIGHSTLLLQFDGFNILTDPHMTQRASPVSFAGPKRFMKPGISIEELPHIDLIVISHNHYDHLDRLTLEKIYQKQEDQPPKIFVPLRQKKWFEGLDITNVVEMDWWEEQEFEVWKIHAVPVQHWSGRSLWDRNQVLWAGWVLEHPKFRFFFAGDTGYSKDFINLGKKFDGFDLAAIPIGAYEPRWFMKQSHINPEESVRIHQDINSRYSVAIHWGTFLFTDEPVDEPPQRLKNALAKKSIPNERFFLMQHGETRSLKFLLR